MIDRVLVGRRKGSIALLGGSWSNELDGGNPFENRSCLLNTARRTVLSQSLLDILDTNICTITKLFELTYHRPQEEFNNKIYPEQDEISIVYLCTINTNYYNSLNLIENENEFENFNDKWNTFVGRISGESIGPTVNLEDVIITKDIIEETKNEHVIIENVNVETPIVEKSDVEEESEEVQIEIDSFNETKETVSNDSEVKIIEEDTTLKENEIEVESNEIQSMETSESNIIAENNAEASTDNLIDSTLQQNQEAENTNDSKEKDNENVSTKPSMITSVSSLLATRTKPVKPCILLSSPVSLNDLSIL